MLDPSFQVTYRREGLNHSHTTTNRDVPPASIRDKIKRRTPPVVHVVGGQTAAEIADLALRRGASKVHMTTRSELKVKDFEVGLQWIADLRITRRPSFCRQIVTTASHEPCDAPASLPNM